MKYAVLTSPQPPGAVKQYSVPQSRYFRHAIFAWLGVRPLLAQHTGAEHSAIQHWARNRKSLVEIGVAEGVSALAAREVMADDGTLSLIDPFHLSRLPAVNFAKRAAHRGIRGCSRGHVQWIEKFSHEAVQEWAAPLDFLLIDGDHSEAVVQRDWEDWSRFVEPGGIVAFHDARLFEGGWMNPSFGPVRVVDRLFRQSQLSNWKVVDEVDSLVVVERIE